MGPDLPGFDELLRLAKEDPEALERVRKASIEAFINNAPEKHQRRLRGIQFNVDMAREKSKNPIAACLKISEMMHQSFSQLRDALNAAQSSKLNEYRQSLSPQLNNSLSRITKKEKASIRVHLPQSTNESKTTVVPFKRQHKNSEPV